MESFLPSEIARLVLGYLEESKCCDAYDIFLNTCPYLNECLKMKREGRKFRTQVLGLTLLEILHEYSAIYSLVQERLKKVDPETAESLKNSGNLLDKITFLINATSSGQTMLFSITLPSGKSPQNSTVAHVRKRLKSAPGPERRKESKKASSQQIAEVHTYPETFETGTGTAAIETTSLSSLPGNSIGINERILNSYDQAPEDITKTPKRKLPHMKKCRSNSEEGDENLDISIITKALLDNRELHEKIAENINKVICTPELNAGTTVPDQQELVFPHNPAASESNTSICASNNFTMELDNAIKKIVQQTESDPVFEHLLQDVVGPLAEETSDDCDDRRISDTSTPYQSTPEINKKQLLKNRLRSSKLKRTESPVTSSSELNTPNKIDHQNAAAIESIVLMNTSLQHEKLADCNITVIENNKETELKEKETEIPVNINTDMVITCTTATHNTATVTAPVTKESTVENIMQPITVVTTPSVVTSAVESIANNVSSSQKILPDGNFNPSLLMVSQQNAIPPQSAIVITETYSQQPLIQDNKIIFLSNKVGGIVPQFLTVHPSQFHQLTQPTVLSDSDILNMPTMIMCGDEIQKSYIPTTFPPKPSTRNNVHIRPKGALPEPSTSFKDSDATNEVLKPKQKLKRKKAVSKSTCETEKLSVPVEAKTKTAEDTQSVAETQLATDIVQESSSSSASVSVAPSVPIINFDSCTKQETEEPPKSPTPNKTSVQMNVSTPRNSRSHVRALDFSTPPKDNLSGKTAMSSPSKSKSPKMAPTNVRTNLFTSPIQIVSIPIATRSPMAKLTGDWDQVQGAGTILGKQKSPQKTRNSLSDSDIVVRSKTKNNESEKIAKLERPRRAASLKFKRKEIAEETKSVTEEINKGSANDSKESLEMDVEVIEEKAKEENESNIEKTSKKSSWDEDLRALVQPVNMVPKRKVTTTKKKSPKRIIKAPRKKSKKKGTNKALNINKTEDDGLIIEKELEKMDLLVGENKGDETSENHCDNSKKEVKIKTVVPKKRRQTKKAKAAELKEKENIEMIKSDAKDQKEIEVEPQDVEIRKDESAAADDNQGIIDNQEQGKETIADNLRHMKPRYNKKCNVGSAVKKNNDNNEEVKCMTIMSPSKMNANKRTLVEPESKKEKETTLPIVEIDSFIASIPSTSAANNDAINISTNKITPDIFQPSTSNPATEKRDLTPVLETPVKNDLLLFPVTPKLFTPFSVTDSPFTRIFKEQPGSCGLSSIPTPSFPMTPKVIFTPNSQCGDSGSYSSRPTDYSNCSSYYQPSDNEQNQRLEQVLIQEAIKQETYVDLGTVTSTPAKDSPSIGKLEADMKNVSFILEEATVPTCSTVEIVDKPKELKVVIPKIQIAPLVEANMKLLSTETQTYEQITGTINESENASQSSIDTSVCSSASDSSTSSSSNCSSSDSDSSNNEDERDSCTNTTVIHVSESVEMKAEPLPERYTLRSSTKQSLFSEKPNKDPDSSSESIKLFIAKKRLLRRISDSPPLMKIDEETAPNKCKSNVTKSHGYLLKELEMKRKRTITLFKTGDENPKKCNKKTNKNQQSPEDNVPVIKRRRGRPRKNPIIQKQIPEEDIAPVRKKEKPNYILKKIISPRKSETIESVAARLMEKKKPDLNEPLNLKIPESVVPSSDTASLLEKTVSSPDTNSVDSSESDKVEKDIGSRYIYNLEDEEFPRLHISSDEDDSKSHDIQVSDPSVKEEDAEILVKNLKERGIHLIPKKLIDKEGSNEEKTSVDEKKNVIEIKELKCSDNIKESMFDENRSESAKLSENACETTDMAVGKNKKIKIRSDIVLDKTEKFDLSKIELSQSIITDTILGRASKLNVSLHDNDEEQQTSSISMSSAQEPMIEHAENIAEKDVKKLSSSEHISLASTTNSNEFFIDEDFYVKVITEDSPEYISIVHDESKKCEKKLSDYNLDGILTKTISAKVYIEELDIDQDKQMVITPFIELLSIAPARKRRNTKKVIEDVTAVKTQRKSAKPLDILYNELVDDSSCEDTATSNNEAKVENEDESKVELNISKTSENIPKSIEQKTSSRKEVPSKSKPKITVQKIEDMLQSPEQQTSSSNDNQLQKKITITLEQYQNKTSKKKTEITCESAVETAGESTIDKKDENMPEQTEEDSLMTFAVLGSEKEAAIETPIQDSKLKKRKATSIIDSSKQNTEKRSKPNDKQAMLIGMDLDRFLTKIHGPSSQ